MAVSSTSEMALKLKAREQVDFVFKIKKKHIESNMLCLKADREEKAQLKILTLNMSTRMEQQENEQGGLMAKKFN